MPYRQLGIFPNEFRRFSDEFICEFHAIQAIFVGLLQYPVPPFDEFVAFGKRWHMPSIEPLAVRPSESLYTLFKKGRVIPLRESYFAFKELENIRGKSFLNVYHIVSEAHPCLRRGVLLWRGNKESRPNGQFPPLSARCWQKPATSATQSRKCPEPAFGP